jgi:shikimate kinase
LAGQQQIVVSTGGGCPCFSGNMEWMNSHGITVYFFATPALLAERLVLEKEHRPLLADIPVQNIEGFIESKLGERTPFYEQGHLKFLVPQLGTEGLLGLGEYLRRFFT